MARHASRAARPSYYYLLMTAWASAGDQRYVRANAMPVVMYYPAEQTQPTLPAAIVISRMRSPCGCAELHRNKEEVSE